VTLFFRSFGIALALLILAVALPATVGAQCPTYVTQWGSTGTGDGQFQFSGGVATDAAGNVYGAEVGPRQVKKYVKK